LNTTFHFHSPEANELIVSVMLSSRCYTHYCSVERINDHWHKLFKNISLWTDSVHCRFCNQTI